MRKFLVAGALAILAALILASVAVAQTDSSGNCLPQQAYVPQVHGCVAAEGFRNLADQANATVYHADTGEPLGILRDLVGPSEPSSTQPSSEVGAAQYDQYVAPQQPTTPAQILPNTGGPALLIIAGSLLLVSGAAAVRILGR